MVYPVSNLPEREPEKKKPKTVGVDANLARHLNFIFAPGGEGTTERVKQWVTPHPTTGRPVKKKIAVLGKLGPTELRTFLILCKLRQESDGPDVTFSLQGTAKLAQLDWHGRSGKTRRGKQRLTKTGRAVQNKSTAEGLRDALMRLRGGLIILANVYYDPDTREFLNIEEGVTILDRLRVVQRTPADAEGNPDDERITLESLFRFNPLIEKSISGGVLKPIVLDALLSIDKRATAAVYAYLYLDRMLYKRTRWTEAGATFLRTIGLSYTYPHPSDRKRVLTTIAKHLDGLAISTGFLRVSVTKRAGDWAISATKLTRAALTEPRRDRSTPLEVEADRTPHSPRAHYEQHRTTVHPEPVGDCPDCRTVAALLKIGTFKRTTAPTQPEPAITEIEAQLITIDVPPATPEATMLPDEQQPPVAQPDHQTPLSAASEIDAVSFEALSQTPAVAPSVPEQSGDTTTPARPTGLAPSEIADA